MDKYIHEDYMGFIHEVRVSHLDCGHLIGRGYMLKNTTNAMWVIK